MTLKIKIGLFLSLVILITNLIIATRYYNLNSITLPQFYLWQAGIDN